MDQFLFQVLTGVSFASLLFLVGAGFSITLVLMNVANLAHGSLYLIAAYVGMTVARGTGNFLAGLAAGVVATSIASLPVQRVFARLSSFPAQILVGIGLLNIVQAASLFFWGPHPYVLSAPALLSGSVPVGDLQFSGYRLFLIGLSFVLGLVLWLGLERTRTGAVIRAGVEDQEMVRALGINLTPVMFWTFLLGSSLAALAGVLGAPVTGIYIGLDFEILIFAFLVVVIGGTGSLKGAALAALLVGVVDSLGKGYFSQLSAFSLYGPMVLILAFRPYGLFGKKQGL